MNRTEREYREALGELRFSEDAKGRMIDNLMEQKEAKPMKRWKIRPLRTGLIAAAVCAALAGTAGAATLIARQANVNFFDSYDEYLEAQRAKTEADGVDYGVSFVLDDLLDYGELGPKDMDSWWNGGKDGKDGAAQEEEGKFITVPFGGGETAETEGEAPVFIAEPGTIGESSIIAESGIIIGEAHIQYDQDVQTLLDEAVGSDEDGWTARRVFQYEWGGQTYLTTKYRAAALSGFDGLWNGWDTAWLEEHYTSNAECAMFENVEADGKLSRFLTSGEFRGQGDVVFNLQYSWSGDSIWGDQNRIDTNLDHIETYTTADGVSATIETATSHTGKTLFWVDFYSGHGSFSMFGTQVELDELHTILDSLNLSRLLEYEPEG